MKHSTFNAFAHPCLPKLLVLPLLLAVLPAGPLPALAENKPKYYDIYLTGDRICEKCTWELIPPKYKDEPQRVELSNRAGERGVYLTSEIVGVDTNPLMRKLFFKSVTGVGLAGKIIVPQAFDDGADYICKYCRED